VKNLSAALVPIAANLHNVAAGDKLFALHHANAGKTVKLA